MVTPGNGIDETLQDLAREGIEVRVVTNAVSDLWRDMYRQEVNSDFWVLPVESGDRLCRGAGSVYRQAAAAAPSTVRIIYADDDLGERGSPHLKPDWNSELFGYFDYLTGAAIARFDASWIHDMPEIELSGDLFKRAAEAGPQPPLHIPRILHHRRARPMPRRPVPPTLTLEQREHLPIVSVIVPTRNRHDLLQACLDGLARTDYPKPLDIIVIDNGSDDPETLAYLNRLELAFARVLTIPGPFNFAALINNAVEQTQGELLCFLNNDIEIDDPDWLTIMARQAMREEVGAVGAQLLYPDGRVQHAGVVLGIGGGAAHAHRLLDPDEEGYFHRHALPQFVSAVTAACLVVKRERFLEVGGFDAENFAVAFNDVDLCMKLNGRGWKSLYEPRARLVHHESVSRGFDRDRTGSERLARELEALQNRWNIAASPDGRTPDQFHHPFLSPYSEQFVLDL
ncbi:MAG: glycosyltransferase family 2 protein [Alteraurantiacibacter sp.]